MPESKIVDLSGKPFQLKASSYNASSTGRHLRAWRDDRSGPNATISAGIPRVRSRSRDAKRNNPWIDNGLVKLAVNEIGVGVVPFSAGPTEKFRNAHDALWEEFVLESDFDTILGFYGQQYQAVLNRDTAGEVFIRLRPRRFSMDLAVPLQVQILESEQCPIEWDRPNLKNGSSIRQGIEYNSFGQRTAFHMYRARPLDGGYHHVRESELVRVPARLIIHNYFPTRPGQIRGEPVTASALVRSYNWESFEDAELIRRRNRSAFTGVVERPEGTSLPGWGSSPLDGSETASETDDDGAGIIDLEAGTFPALPPGEKLNLFSSDERGDPIPIMRQALLGVAAGVGLPAEILSGDYSMINDRTARAALNQFYRKTEILQQNLTVFQVCRGVHRMFLEMAVLSGRLAAPGYADRRREYQKCVWQAQPWRYLNPTQDIQAKRDEMDIGLTSRLRLAPNYREIDRENAESQSNARGANAVYGTGNPASGVTQSGAEQDSNAEST